MLNSIQPKKVFEFFREISAIPHGSGNTTLISKYCLDFARKRNLKTITDEGDNIIIYADGTAGYENSEPIMIQGHMDMVCEKTDDCRKDMQKEGLTLCTDGTWLWADGTTLGGDDGIALAYIFAILDSDDIPHPPIEAVITRDEETGMSGAELFNPSNIKAKKILNIDSEEEGILTVSCAGGITAHCEIPLTSPKEDCDLTYEIKISGLVGGHSGMDINKGRENAFHLLGSLMTEISNQNIDFLIADISGGGKLNVIPQSASAIIGTKSNCMSNLSIIFKKLKNKFRSEYNKTESDICISLNKISTSQKFYDITTTKTLITFLFSAPTGVYKMSKQIEGLVESSLNLGYLELLDTKISTQFLIRSNNAKGKQEVIKKVENFSQTYNGKCSFNSDYPAWEYNENSPLREIMVEAFYEQYGKKPVISAIHAGLECGIFSQKIENTDIVSFGPDIKNIHTPAERLNIASTERTWIYLKEILKRLK